MAYDIRLMKLVTGELVIGKYHEDSDTLTDVAAIQTIPAQQGMQMMMLPYGYPFDTEFTGTLEGRFFIFRYAATPKELQDKYIEASTNLAVAGGLGKLKFGNPAGGPPTSNGIITG